MNAIFLLHFQEFRSPMNSVLGFFLVWVESHPFSQNISKCHRTLSSLVISLVLRSRSGFTPRCALSQMT